MIKHYNKKKKSKKNLDQNLDQIKSGSNKSENQSNTVNNVTNLYNSGEKIIDLLYDNSRIRSESIYKVNKKSAGTGLKLLPPKQIVQRFPIVLAQVKAGNR